MLLCLAGLLGLLSPVAAQTPTDDAFWTTRSGDGAATVHLHFFWSRSCPHCRQALPFVEALGQEYPWLAVHAYEVRGERANLELYLRVGQVLGVPASSVPGFAFCRQLLTGFDTAEGRGAELRAGLLACRQQAAGGGGAAQAAPSTPFREPTGLTIPVLGRVDAARMSLPVLTLVIAGLDAFNPCAFFVLLFLLSLLVHARSRLRMAVIGATFVFFSGLVYFLFMAAWLNVFLVLGEVRAVTVVAGAVALVVGALNVKDFFWLGAGPSLSIPESAKPDLYRRVRGIVNAGRPAALVAGTVALALAANSYELLCTAGFPMVYTRILTLNGLSSWGYYGYLALYNLIYVVPLALIVTVFTVTLGARKLSEDEGRLLKLVSGMMMLGLGALLLVAPEQLSTLPAALGVLVAAGLGSALLWAADRARRRGSER